MISVNMIEVRNLLVTLAIVVVLLLLYRCSPRRRHWWGVLLLTLFAFVVFRVTGVSPMSAFSTTPDLAGAVLTPFSGIIGEVQRGTQGLGTAQAILSMLTNIQVGGNILLFMPLGFLLPLLWERWRRLGRVVLFGFLLSFGIETWQLFLSRTTDVDDLILNTLGMALGFALCALYLLLARRRGGRWLTERPERGLAVWAVLVPGLVTVALGFVDRCFYL